MSRPLKSNEQAQKLQNELDLYLAEAEARKENRRIDREEKAKREEAKAKGEASSPYLLNLNTLAKSGEINRAIGRDSEIKKCITILCRRKKGNPALIGEAGVGKTAIAEGLACGIVSGNVVDRAKNWIVYSLDFAGMLAGCQYRGMFEDRLTAVMKEVEANEHVVIFIDELHMIAGAGATKDSSMDAANMLKPALARGKFQCIGATTNDEYNQYIEKDPALARRFQRVEVREPTVSETIDILKGLKSSYENHHGVKYTHEAIKAAAVLSDKYITDRQLPDKAIDFLDEAGAEASLSEVKKVTKKSMQALVNVEEIIAPVEVSKKIGFIW